MVTIIQSMVRSWLWGHRVMPVLREGAEARGVGVPGQQRQQRKAVSEEWRAQQHYQMEEEEPGGEEMEKEEYTGGEAEGKTLRSSH